MTMRPFKPMSPLQTDRLPQGAEWGFQLKWDGYRLIANVEEGGVRLFTKNMLPAEGKFPEIAQALSSLPGKLLLDGEAVVLDPASGRPSFQLVQQRNKAAGASGIRRAADKLPVQYIVFDVLRIGEEDLRSLPFEERDRRLRELAADWHAPLFTTDLFPDGTALWRWVQANGWEGIVCKRLSSPYREGKEHRDWFKRKSMPEFDVEIVGLVWREGRVASMIMKENGDYFGRVSLGLNGALKDKLRQLDASDDMEGRLQTKPPTARGERIRWLIEPIGARVTGSEVTDDGVLRHPKLVSLEL